MADPTDFVSLDIAVTEQDMVDGATAYLQNAWADWVPNDGDLEVVLLEALGPLASNAAEIAANMPMAALIAFGTKLLGQQYNPGTSAYTSVTFTVQDSAGYTIPAGSQLEIDGSVFSLTDDAVVAAGSTTAVQIVASSDYSASANGLTGTSSLTSLTMPAFVTAMSVISPTTGGSDPQTDLDFANQISRDRRMTSKALITLLDFELEALDVPGIGRAHADKDTSRNVTITVTDTVGNAASTATKAAVLAATSGTGVRMVNANVSIADPTYHSIAVAYTAVSVNGTDPTDLQTRINAALGQELSPLGWGVPQTGDPGSANTTWNNVTTVYLNRLIGVIAAVAGVYRVTTVTINGSAADFVMTGVVPLPQPGVFTGTIT